MSVSDVSRSLQRMMSFNHPSVVLTADVFQYLMKNMLWSTWKRLVQKTFFFFPSYGKRLTIIDLFEGL